MTAPPTLTAITVPRQWVTTGTVYCMPKKSMTRSDTTGSGGSWTIGMLKMLPISEANSKNSAVPGLTPRLI